MTSSKIYSILYCQWLLLKPSVYAYGGILCSYWVLAFFGLYSMEIAVSLGQIVIILSPLALFSREEETGIYEYLLTLPQGREGGVTARYLFALSATMISTVFTIILVVLWDYLLNKSVLSVLLCLLLSSSFAVIFLDIALPLFYLLGAKKGRPWFYLLVLMPVALVVLFLPWLEPIILSIIGRVGELQTLGYFVIGLTFSLAGLLPSCLISLKIVEKR